MAVQNGFIPVTVWVHYNHSYWFSRGEFEYLKGEILDYTPGRGVLPQALEVGSTAVGMQGGIQPFEVFINSFLVFSKCDVGRYPTYDEVNKIIDVIKEVYSGAQPRRIDGL